MVLPNPMARAMQDQWIGWVAVGTFSSFPNPNARIVPKGVAAHMRSGLESVLQDISELIS